MTTHFSKLFVIFGIFIIVSNGEIHVEEANLVELHKYTFYKVSHKVDKHVIIELYSSEAWCSEF